MTAVEGKEVQSIEKESVSRTSYTIRRILEPGPQPRPRNASASRRLSRKCYILCAIAVVIALAAIAVPIAITLSRKHDRFAAHLHLMRAVTNYP